MKKIRRIGILTSGGDCPGINAVIRGVGKKAMQTHGWEVVGIEDGYEGLVKCKHRKLRAEDLSGILTLGGTILGTTKKANPYRFASNKGGELTFTDESKTCIRNVRKLGLDCLVVIGGDGTLGIAYKLFKDGIPIIGVPKTIDNDIIGTDITFGFDSATRIATEGIDRLHTTAQSHHRVMIIEVMGHRAGWIALYAGLAGGGDIILLPEIPYDIDKVIKKIEERNRYGKRFSIVVVSEGAKPRGGDVVVQRIVKESSDPIRLGGIGMVLAQEIEKATCIETRAVVMGHLLRGGSPTPFDRVLSTELGTKAADMIAHGTFGHMAAMKERHLVAFPLKDVAKGYRSVPLDHHLIKAGRDTGVSFGD